MHGMRNKFGTIVALGLFNKAFGAYSFPKILVDEEKYRKLDSWSKDGLIFWPNWSLFVFEGIIETR